MIRESKPESLADMGPMLDRIPDDAQAEYARLLRQPLLEIADAHSVQVEWRRRARQPAAAIAVQARGRSPVRRAGWRPRPRECRHRILLQNGILDPAKESVKAQMQALHPQNDEPMPGA